MDGGYNEQDIYIKVDELPGNYYLGQKGENNLWTFTTLQAPRASTYRYTKASDARFGSYFKEADMVVRAPFGKEVFYLKKGAKWYEVGYAALKEHSIDPQIVKYAVPIPSCIPEVASQMSTYQATFESEGQKVVRHYTEIQDASGTLYMADGTYDADRIKREVTYVENGIEVVKTSYIFADQLTHAFLMKVDMNGEEIDKITFKSTEGGFSSADVMKSNSFLLYPNIGYGEVRLEFLNFNPGRYQFIVKDVVGKQVWSTSYQINGDITLKEDLSFLARGTYTYTIIDGAQNNVVTRRLAIIKS